MSAKTHIEKGRKERRKKTHCQDTPFVSSESLHLGLGVLRLAPVERSSLLIVNDVIPSWIRGAETYVKWNMIFFELKYDIFGSPIPVSKGDGYESEWMSRKVRKWV